MSQDYTALVYKAYTARVDKYEAEKAKEAEKIALEAEAEASKAAHSEAMFDAFHFRQTISKEELERYRERRKRRQRERLQRHTQLAEENEDHAAATPADED